MKRLLLAATLLSAPAAHAADILSSYRIAPFGGAATIGGMVIMCPSSDGSGTAVACVFGGGGGGTTGAVNLTQVGGTTFNLGQATKAGSLPVTLASDQGALAVTGAFYQATQPVSGNVGLLAGSALIGAANIDVGGVALAFGQATMANSLPVAFASNQSALPVTSTPAPNSPGTSAASPSYTASYQPTYQLLGAKGGTGSTTTGAAVGPVYGGSYLLSVSGTFAGASAQFQVLGPDGVTWQNVGAAVTAAGTVGVVIGSSQGSTTPNARVFVTGSGYSLFASLS